jgi:tetratricopeptide (TPR) repeat protein
MQEPASLSVVQPAENPTPIIRSGKRGVVHFLVAPVRAIWLRPRRAIIFLTLFILIGGALAAFGVWIWFEWHLNAARESLDAGHNSEAVRHLRSCQRIRPEQRDVLLLSARVARRAASWDEADAFLTEYWERYGDEEPLIFERLLYRTARGELESVSSALSAKLAQGGPQSRLVREALVAGLTYRFRWQDIRILLEAWLAESPDDTLALLHQGKYFEQQHAFDDAIRTYRRIIELDPEQLEARLRLATLYISRRFGEEAAAELAILRARLPEHPEIQVLWARALSLLGRTEEADAVIDACLQSHPDYPSALLEKGTNALIEGDEATAEQCLAAAARLDPGNSLVHTKYALVLSRNGKTAQAAEQYARAHQLETDGERITQIIRGPFQEHPNDPAVHHEIGMIALRCGLVDDALRWFNSALQVDPNHLPTHQVLTNLYRELDRPALMAKHRAIAQKLTQQQRKN